MGLTGAWKQFWWDALADVTDELLPVAFYSNFIILNLTVTLNKVLCIIMY